MTSKDWSGNVNSVWKTLGASNHTENEREADDYYATDPIAIDKLLEVEKPHRFIWECACGGCWFCPKQCMADLWSLWKNYPDLYNRLLEMEPYSHNTFKPRGVTLALLAQRFENGYIPKRKAKSKFVQLDMFDKI